MGILGTTELLLIMVAALVVFGPQRLPELAKYIAKGVRMFQEASRELRTQLDINDWDLDKPKKPYMPDSDRDSSATVDEEDYDFTGEEYHEANQDIDAAQDNYDDAYGYGSDMADKSKSPGMTMEMAAVDEDEPMDDPAKDQDSQRRNRELVE